MAIQKPSKPDVTLPSNFGGTKTPYTDSQISNGYQEAVPQVVDGGNINYEKDAVFKYLKYLKTATDALVDMPIGKILTVDSNNRFEYANPTVIANDSEYEEGALTTKSPSVKQVRDSFADLDGRITNCITKIPQDIKLELNDGTLTLKAGSKIYDEKGNPIVINNDISTDGAANRQTMLFYRSGVLQRIDAIYTYSGDTAPEVTSTFAMWYDTANKLIKFTNNNGEHWVSGYSYPLCIATETNTGFTSINQVFNGFGYIGSTVFALPGVEGLIPNRFIGKQRNNIKFTTTRVITFSPTTGTNNVLLTLTANRFFWNNSARYDQENNYNLNDVGIISQLILGYANVVSGRVTSFNPKTIFQATDYYDFKQLDDSAAKLGENNTFTGINTFRQTPFMNTSGNSYGFIAQNNNINVGQTPPVSQYIGYDFRGNNGKRLAFIGIEYNQNGGKYLTFQNLNNAYNSAVFATNVQTQGVLPISDNSNKLATTAFVNNFITNLSSTVGSGYVYIGNLLICWGTWINGVNTFPRPFANTNYGLANIGEYSFDTNDNNIKSLTTTGFTGQVRNKSVPTRYIAIGQRG